MLAVQNEISEGAKPNGIPAVQLSQPNDQFCQNCGTKTQKKGKILRPNNAQDNV